MPRIISLDQNERLLEPVIDSLSLHSRAPEPARAHELLEPAEVHVLHLAAGQAQPVTKGQLARLSGLSPTEIYHATDVLCHQRMLRRLNTLVESFVVNSPVQS